MDILKHRLLIILFFLLVQQATAQTSVLKAFEKSYTMEAAQKYTEAITTLKAVYEVNSYELNLRLGWLYYLAADYKTSIIYYKKATEIYPLSIEAKLGYVYPLSAVYSWDEVIVQYKSILKMNSYNSQVNYSLGLIYYYRKDYTAAKQYLDLAITSYPFDYDIVVLSGWNNLMLGKTEESKKLFNRALLLKPNDTSATDGLKKASN
jgi:tetratricopeptide (TPR) repeat protein